MTAHQTQLLGQLLNQRYRIIEPLGSGGFSRTYLAEDIQKPDTPKCVIKHLRPASNDPTFLQPARRLFKGEVEALKALGHHDQIPELFEAFEEEQEFYLAQEFIDGYPLNLEMAPGQRWSEEQVLKLLQEVLSILTFVHSYGVIHRDLKPDNIIRRQHDNKLVLIDFGSVKQIQTQLVTPQGHLSATVAVGTPGYLSSEQGQGKPRPNSDIYSLGLIGVQVLTGLHPTQLQDDPETGEKSWRQHVQVSDGFAYVLDKMVRYHHKDRYASTEDAQQALQQVVDGSIVLPSATPQSPNPSTPAVNPTPEPTPVLAASANPSTPAPRSAANPPQWQRFIPYANMVAVATVIAAAIAFNLHQSKLDKTPTAGNSNPSPSASNAPQQQASPQPKPSAAATKPNSTQSNPSTPTAQPVTSVHQPTAPPNQTSTQAPPPNQPTSKPDSANRTSLPEQPITKPSSAPKPISPTVTKKPDSTHRPVKPPPSPPPTPAPTPIPTASAETIVPPSARNFVSDYVRAGKLKDQNIPGFQPLASGYRAGNISVEDIINAGVKAKVLPPEIVKDEKYISIVKAQMDMIQD
jgi:serine/threonine protein kinase, bacterial